MFSKVFCTAALALVSYVAVPTLNVLRLNAEKAATSEARQARSYRFVSAQAANDLQPVAADLTTALVDMMASSSRTAAPTSVVNPFQDQPQGASIAEVLAKLDEMQKEQDKLSSGLETAQQVLADLTKDLSAKTKKPLTYGGVLASLSKAKTAVEEEDKKLKADGVCDCNCDCASLLARIEALEAKVAALSNVSSVKSSGGGSTGSATSRVYYSNPTTVTTYSTTSGGSTGSVQANPYVQSVMPTVSDDARVRIVEPRRVTRADVQTTSVPMYVDESGNPSNGQCVQNADGTYSCPQAAGYSTQTTAVPRRGLLGLGLLGRRN